MSAFLRDKRLGIAAPDIIVTICAVLLVLGTAIPAVNEHMAASARARALGDLRQLAADVSNYYRDTGSWPVDRSFAYTDGLPAEGEEDRIGSPSASGHLARFLVTNEPPVRNWKGPYMSISRPDPWGHRYVVTFEGLRRSPLEARHGWVLCAGPDGVFQTGADDSELRGDDLGLALR